MTIKTNVNMEDVLEVLNRALKKDPACISELFNTRIPAGTLLAQDETIQVQSEEEGYTLSMLGLLNGIFGADTNKWGAVQALWEGDKLVRFEDNGRR